MWKAFDHKIKRERRKNGTIEELFCLLFLLKQKKKRIGAKNRCIFPRKTQLDESRLCPQICGRKTPLSSRKLSVNHFLIIRHKIR